MFRKAITMILLLSIMVESTQAANIDNLIVFLANPGSEGLVAMVGNYPWWISAPYVSAISILMGYDSYVKNKESLDMLGVNQDYLWREIYRMFKTMYYDFWGFRVDPDYVAPEASEEGEEGAEEGGGE